ncbi:hypothetical protein [Sphingomonas sp. BK069]|uniref:hypothetical protein n=1 Tax=Sphingomonas sp. BK069 TaxID=2586979 RepID=UPI001610756E|nr:hypothetical protein [Sphingomonas sp. BK069]MBB3348430.1 hypothetical protein [Sphingomonas sp. BK069]
MAVDDIAAAKNIEINVLPPMDDEGSPSGGADRDGWRHTSILRLTHYGGGVAAA